MRRWEARTICGLVVALGCLVGGAVQAQEARVALTPLQEQLLRDAVQESQRTDREPDYQAMRLNYEAALQKGEADILYVGLSRALFRQGLCFEAQDTLRQAAQAPNSTLATREEIQQQILRYQGDLERMCPGALQVACADPKLKVVVAQQPVACGQRLSLPPGQHTLRWTLGQHAGADTFQIKRLEVTSLSVPSAGLPQEQKEPRIIAQPGPEPTPPEGNSGLRVAGWSLVGVGALAFTGGGLSMLRVIYLDGEAQDLAAQNRIDGDEVYDLEDEAKLFESLQWAGLGIGAACTLGGLLLLWLDGEQEEAPQPSVGLSLWGSPQDAGVQLQGRW